MRLENGTEFVEIERVGRHLSIRRGRIGTRGETREKRSGDFDSNLLGFLRKGFTRMPGEIPPEVFAIREPALEQALREHRDDPDAYAIYADWLQANGNPAGELIAVAREREAKADIAPKLQKRYDALVSRLRMPLPDAATLHWRHGMWQTLRLENKHDFRTSGARHPRTLDFAIASALLRNPLCAALERLVIGALHSPSNHLLVPRVIAEAATQAWAADLVSLEIGACASDPDWQWYMTSYNAGELGGAISNAFPKLRELAVWTNLTHGHVTTRIANLALPELRSLALRGRMDADRIGQLGTLKAPLLERLEVWGTPDLAPDPGTLRPHHLTPYLERFPHLQHLGIVNARHVLELVEAVPQWPIARRLRTLDFSISALNQQAADRLIATRAAYPAIEELVLDKCLVPPAALRQLRAVYPKVTGTPFVAAYLGIEPLETPAPYRGRGAGSNHHDPEW